MELSPLSLGLSSDVGPTEDVVQALLEYLVAPMLPLKPSAREAPPISQQQLIAKQVHAVVLLYNYYHRRHHPKLEFLGFESFCKLAVILEPAMIVHMKLMLRSDYFELDDLENQISLTERAIMDACDIAVALDASKDIPDTEGWPIAKIAVFLVDSRRQNCLLIPDSITRGVSSVIEKDLNSCNISSEVTLKSKHIYKRKGITRKTAVCEMKIDDEAALQQLAFLAVKETTGTDTTNLMVLESHVGYSLSKEKTAVRFYIMQSTELIDEDLQFPVRDVIESLQGFLVKRNSDGWMVTPLVEYFHVLPYTGFLSDWFSREVFAKNLQNLRMEDGNGIIYSHHTEKPHHNMVTKDADKSNEKDNCMIGDSTSNVASYENSELPKNEDNGISQSHSAGGPHGMYVDHSSLVCVHKKVSCRNQLVIEDEMKMTNSMGGALHESAGVNAEIGTECNGENAENKNGIYFILSSDQERMAIRDQALNPFQPNSGYLEKLHITLASKEDALSETALRVLLKKRTKLSHQLCSLEDEMALCDKSIQTILDGGEDDLAQNKKSIVDDCNDVSLKSSHESQDHTDQLHGGLAQGIVALKSPCQQLDDICCQNNWILPRYHLSLLDGEFLADVTVKGMDFEFTVSSSGQSKPHEAREMAAGKMITKLFSAAGYVAAYSTPAVEGCLVSNPRTL